MKVQSPGYGLLLEKALNALTNATIAISRHPSRNSLSVYRTIRDFRALQEVSNRDLQNISQYIIRRKYVTISKHGGVAHVELTSKGKTVMQHHALRALQPLKQKVWDHKWRLVMFDIPNHMKTARDGFAATLKRLGFMHYQKSVFICPYPCEEELEVVAEYYGVGEHVDIVAAERITHAESFIQSFGIKV